MKIGIISDTHGCADRFKMVYNNFLEDADLLIHAGDILYHGPRNPILEDYNPALLAERINACKMPVVIARGNCDSEVDQLVLNTPIQAPFAYAFFDNKKIIVNHGHLFQNEQELDKMAEHLKADIFVTGHIHTTILEKRGNTLFINPGSISLSKRDDKKATCCIIEDNVATIFDVDTKEVLDRCTI